VKRLGWLFLLVVALSTLGAGWLAPYSFSEQLRDNPGAGPDAHHWLGTDALGRDRWSRLLYGARVSLLLAPAAALLTLLLGFVIGAAAALRGGWTARLLNLATDLTISLPWLFLLLIVRAALPLNLSPTASVLVTFFLLGALGWPGPARIVQAAVRSQYQAPYLLQARAAGVSPVRLWFRHLAPNLRPVLAAQLLAAIPAFLLGEANLGMLGLGVTEPLPSLGNLLSEVTQLSALAQSPWLLAPALLLLAVLLSLRAVSADKRVS
jgi:ABC-type dipeptide/oligopeptide/nickel transport system permease subunit